MTIARIIPLHREEENDDTLFVGIDVGKMSHVAALLSRQLLARHQRYEKCPTLALSNTRTGFEALVQTMKHHAALERCMVLLERTGHYHRALADYLQAQGIAVYVIHVQERPNRSKSDKRDAQSLANILYNQRCLGIQIDEKSQAVHRLTPPSETAARLRGLARHHYELTRETTRRYNKLTAIADQLFPELTDIFKNPNAPTALHFRETFATPADIMAASFADLKACRIATRPSNAALLRLQGLARHTIGLTDPAHIEVLLFEQRQLVAELRLLEKHREALDAKIAPIVQESREGKILLSTGIMGSVQAATIISSIGSIANFETAGHLKSYFGWSPHQRQTGTSYDSMTQTRGGNRLLRFTLYMIGWNAVRDDTEWRELYERLIPLKCQWDARTKQYKAKNKVLGRIIGQIIALLWHLLRKDYDTLASLRPGEEIPEPTLYSREIHRGHRHRRP